MNTAANYGGFILHGTITTTVTITTVVMMPAEPKTYKRKSTQFKPLTAMQEAYCQSYIKTPENQTQAAINAGFSPNTAAVKASVMMRDERIQKRIAELMEERNKRMRVSADYVLMRLVEIDQMDVLDILNDDGGMKPIAEWPKVWRTSLSAMDIATIKTTQASLQKENGEADFSVEDVEHILKKVKWPDKVKNLELIGKHVDVNAFKERLDVNVNVTIADRIAAARKRLKERQDGNQ
ncbi:terminase small subunit [Escherichia coli]|uniref:terminase small subunit n=1 Tax=Escherichia coli TaxID=562 RepID=UPI000BE9DFEE|nr:terminase small subunit [Escherichia coli]EIP9428962.1 terminase small subunit [Escherichia coli]MCN5210961.1 terminase small subunit [Escherichia coli]